jgi:hypothetical protein
MKAKRWVVWVANLERACGYERLCICFDGPEAENIKAGYEYMQGIECLVLPEGRKPRGAK